MKSSFVFPMSQHINAIPITLTFPILNSIAHSPRSVTQPISSPSPSSTPTILIIAHISIPAPILAPQSSLPESHTSLPTTNTRAMQTKSKSGIFKPKTLLTTKHHFPSDMS